MLAKTDVPDKTGPVGKAFFTADPGGSAHLVTGGVRDCKPGIERFTASGEDLHGNAVTLIATC